MQKEFEFLNIIQKTLSDPSYLGDDCAYLDELKLAVSSDSLCEDVHFKTSLMNPYEIAKKSLLVNISDILASGAKPLYAMISLCGSLDNDFILEFYKGIDEIAQRFKIKIIGGDLCKASKINITITVFGSYNNRVVSSRKNAKPGYIVATAGVFGSSAQGLEDLLNNPLCDNCYIKIHKEPLLYPQVSGMISKNVCFPYAMMDSSDGLVDCLYQISNKSNVRIDIEYNKIPKNTKNKDHVLYGGEDYCLVVCLDKRDFEKLECENLIRIGTCSEGCGVFLDNTELDYRGYNHFE